MGNSKKIEIINISMIPEDMNKFLGRFDPSTLKVDTISSEIKKKEDTLKTAIKIKLLWEMVYSKEPPEKLEIVVAYEKNDKKLEAPFKEKYKVTLDDTADDIYKMMKAVEEVSTVTANKIMQDILYHLVIEKNLFAQ